MYQPADFAQCHKTKILVDRRAALGDVLMITPVLRELRRRWPEAFIQVATEEPDALTNNPHVDQVVHTKDMTLSGWDMYYNLNNAYEYNTASHYVDSILYRAFGMSDVGIDRSLVKVPTQDERDAVDDAVEQIGSEYVVVHMRQWAWPNKNIPPKTWNGLFDQLLAAYPNIKIVGVGAKHDFRLAGHPSFVDLCEQLTIGEIQHLISRARLFVGTDSGPYHIACTTNTPVLLFLNHLFPSHILHWRGGKFGKDIAVAQSPLPCVGCYVKQNTPVSQLVCSNPVQYECAGSYDPQVLFNLAKQLMEKNK